MEIQIQESINTVNSSNCKLATAKLQYPLNKLMIESLPSGGLPEDVPKNTLKTLKASNLIFSN